MKTILKISLLGIIAIGAACAPPANTNTTTNTNTNTAPTAAAPTADALVTLEKAAWEAFKNKDGKFFETFLADNFVGFEDDGKRSGKADVVKMISEHKCEVKSYALTEPKLTTVSPDVYVLTYKGTQEGTCEGKALPANTTVVTAFIRSGSSWKGVYHNEVAIVEPPTTGSNTNMNKPAPAAASAEAGEEGAVAEKKEAPAAPASNSTTATTSNSNTSTSGDALTDAIMAVEKRGWDAWMRQDAKGLEETTAKDLTFVNSMGKVTQGQADVIKMWTDGTCKVTSTEVTDGKATQIANNVAILTFKGTAVGTCGTMKLEPLYGTTIAIKDGDAWRAVYIFETPVRKS